MLNLFQHLIPFFMHCVIFSLRRKVLRLYEL